MGEVAGKKRGGFQCRFPQMVGLLLIHIMSSLFDIGPVEHILPES